MADITMCAQTQCPNAGHDIHAHDKQYGCAEDGCDCETPNVELRGRAL